MDKNDIKVGDKIVVMNDFIAIVSKIEVDRFTKEKIYFFNDEDGIEWSLKYNLIKKCEG